jgi:hypothetical protein
MKGWVCEYSLLVPSVYTSQENSTHVSLCSFHGTAISSISIMQRFDLDVGGSTSTASLENRLQLVYPNRWISEIMQQSPAEPTIHISSPDSLILGL